MSPINKKKLKKLRQNLDKLDNSFIKLIKKRTNLVKEVLKLKQYKKEIVDKKRIKAILSQIKRKSIKNNIDPKITNRIWKNMIMSYIDYERRNFKKKIVTYYEVVVFSQRKLHVFLQMDYIFLLLI